MRWPQQAGSWSIAGRLTAWYTLAAFSLVLVATGFLYWALVGNLQEEDQRLLADKVHVLRTLLRERAKSTADLKELEWEWAPRQYEPVYVRILDESEQVLVETPGMDQLLAPNIFPAAVPDASEPQGTEIRGRNGERFHVMAAHARSVTGQPRVIQAALDLARDKELLTGYRTRLWIVLGGALFFSAWIGHSIARRGIRPLEEIADAASRIRSTTLNERIDGIGLPAEVASLASSFNEMLDRLEDSFNRLSQFSADIAHELRTPVNNLRGEAEVALGRGRSPEEYREVLGSCLEECGRLSRIIDSLLFVARAENPEAKIERETVNLRIELQKVAEFYDAAAAEQGITLSVEVPPDLTVEADRTLLHRAVGNLVSNALAHTQSGGAIVVGASRTAPEVRIEVSDNGLGISADDLPHIFDRFYRADKSRSSTTRNLGLGLAIVKSIAALHGGSINITSKLGEGTRATLILPHSLHMTNL